MSNEIHPLQAISPVDGRYRAELAELAEYFSEQALMRYRIKIEALYFIALSDEPKIKQVRRFTKAERVKIHSLYENFSLKNAERVKEIEKTTNHDVKSVEYYIKEKLQRTSLKSVLEFVHFGLTSEDINNIAFTSMLRDSVLDVYVPEVKSLVNNLQRHARRYKKLSMLSLTHGQPATPTTLGKEYAVVLHRLKQQLVSLQDIKYNGKFGGATGNWAAQYVAYPQVNWMAFAKKFITSLGLEPNLTTTQIEPHDKIAEAYHAVARINTIIKDFDQDMWHYISRGIFIQQNKAGEVGSSAMPHKINPIYFENSEGNVGLANALLIHLADKLPISRMQRDLTDSTVLRNQGVVIAHSVLAVRNIAKALQRVHPNNEQMKTELNNHWEVLAEPIQTVMRRLGKNTPYEQLKKLTRGQQLNKETLHAFIDGLDIPVQEKTKLKELTPANYIGLSEKIAIL
ncbi:MAG: adenylosuccinate lyase [bacterium]|nr:adenylosuccinate lyase [bacterium]